MDENNAAGEPATPAANESASATGTDDQANANRAPAGDLPEGDQGAAATNGDDTAAESDDEGEDGEGEEEPKPKKPKGRFQKRIDRLTARINDLERERQQTGRAPAGDQPNGRAPSADAEPRIEDYPTYDDYLVAKAAHKVEQRQKQLDAERRQASARETHQQTVRAHAERVDDARDRYDDFDEVAGDERLPISQPMAQAIIESDNGPDIQYWLGKHPDEAKRISKLSPVAQIREIGKIEAKVSTPPPKRITSAPAPAKSLNATGGGKKAADEMSMDEYRAARESGKLK